MYSLSVPQTAADAGARSVEAFARQIFGYLPRADQRRWAGIYLKGLLLTDGKKSVRRLAGSVSDSPTVSYSLQQFINSSPWDWEPGRDALVRWIEQRSSVRAWTVTPVILPKRGDQSVGVHQRFDPLSGRTVNCQMATVLFLSCPGANFPVDWRLLLPRQWADDPGLRRRARIPETETCRPQWRHTLDLIADRAGRTGAPRVPVVADLTEAPDVRELTELLDATGLDFVVAVHPRALAGAGQGGAGRAAGRTAGRPAGHPRGAARGRARRRTAGGPDAGLPRMWNRHAAAVTGSDGRFRQAQVLSALIWRPVREGPRDGGERRAYRLFRELGPDGTPDSRIWLTNLVHHRLDELLELARCYVSSLDTAECLDGRYELLDFAGRSFPAWHHHMTMVSAAYAHLRLVGPAQPTALAAAGLRLG
ncbi:IS701 family transposase [Streptomyces griseosporeus]|uniref:IS701 family transposase n=1 Tax=Streptomyces griseosporeus TaxID=1910 RepID=UPI0036BA7F98